ncbi:MAG: hypothetical protein ACFFFH_16960 [Candidatus Thorarchaeota archaeon]
MPSYYYLERKTPENTHQVIPLGTFTGNSFYPTMAYDVFEVLVSEAQFTIHDEAGNNFTIDSFKDTICHTYFTNPPVISLNVSS